MSQSSEGMYTHLFRDALFQAVFDDLFCSLFTERRILPNSNVSKSVTTQVEENWVLFCSVNSDAFALIQFSRIKFRQALK